MERRLWDSGLIEGLPMQEEPRLERHRKFGLVEWKKYWNSASVALREEDSGTLEESEHVFVHFEEAA